MKPTTIKEAILRMTIGGFEKDEITQVTLKNGFRLEYLNGQLMLCIAEKGIMLPHVDSVLYLETLIISLTNEVPQYIEP